MTPSSIKSLSTEAAPKPVGPYSQAIVANGWLYCSGQIAINPETNQMIGNGDIEKETNQVISNLMAVLKAGGANPSMVVKTTIYLVSLKDFQVVNNIYGQVFDQESTPARACVEVSGLPKGAKVEIDCIAYIG